MQCPEIDVLHQGESLAHLQECEACRLLVDLSMLERPDPNACRPWEGLLSIVDELRDVDAKGLHAHLANCSACFVTHLILAEDSDAISTKHSPRQGVAMEDVYQAELAASGARRAAIVGVVVLAAVVLVFLFQKPEGIRSVATTAEDDKPVQRQSASRPTVAAKRPALLLAPDSRFATLLAQTKQANQEGRRLAALGYCSEAIAIDIESQESRLVCAIAACNLSGDAASQLREAIEFPSWQEAAKIACERAPVAKDVVEGDEALAGIFGELMDQSTSASKSMKYDESLVACELALTFKPASQEARVVCAIAACSLEDQERSQVHVGGLEDKRYRKMASQICLSKGIVVDED